MPDPHLAVHGPTPGDPPDLLLSKEPQEGPPTRWVRLRRRLAPQAIPLVAHALLASWLIAAGLHRWIHAQVGYDLGYFTQAVWKIQHGHAPYVTMSARHVLGDHTYWVIYPLAWVLEPFPTGPGLIVTQAVVLAGGVWPLAALCRRLELSVWATVLALTAYALFPAVHNHNTSDVHLEFFVVPALLAAVAAAVARRWWLYGLAVGCALLNREDVAITVVCLGLLVAFSWSRRAGLLTTGAALAVGLLDRFVVLTHFSYGHGYVHNDELPYGPSIAHNISFALHHPSTVFGDLGSEQNALFVLALLGPVAFLPLLSGRYLLPVLPVEVLLLLSQRAGAHTIDGWYTAQAIPFVFVALAFSLQRLAPVLSSRGAPLLMLGSAALAGYLALSLDSWVRSDDIWEPSSPRAQAIRDLTKDVPPGVPVSSSPTIWSYLAERMTLVGYPVPADWVIIEKDNPFLVTNPLPASCTVLRQEDLIVLAHCTRP